MCNQGQLKKIAAIFYTLFHDTGVLYETNGQATFPWTTSSSDDANYAPANIGQVKAMFNFRSEDFYQ